MSTSLYQLEKLSSMMGITLSKTQIEQFSSYLALLVQEAQRVNITGIRDEGEIITRHFLDSLSCAIAVKLTPGMRVLDVGSGAGFPGVPLKIYAPEIQLTVMDSSQKHLNFLYKLRGILRDNLSDSSSTGFQPVCRQDACATFEILEGRAEEYGQSEEHREAYDLVVSRAVAKMNILTEYCLPLVKIGGSTSGSGSTSGRGSTSDSGYFIAMKGQTGDIEARDAESVIQMLGGEIDDLVDVILPDRGSPSGNSKRMLIKVLKIRQTPAEYPRRTGVPEKKPLN
ncbi:16S rRNA (guanine(527)-N(7))-methyltransferase RsmG [bacterium]|nr:16S rRNA (guanine(527)-N(7))-methyltransferase RsmG [bacterium]MBU1754289.1 16S rRNA (guanine(527)-N(7))-methyltransferase RsmG [bacterium]